MTPTGPLSDPQVTPALDADEPAGELDLDQVLREIDQEVAARRAAGDFPPGLERDLDLVFARFAPSAASGDDLEGMLEAADRNAFIDLDVPTGSRLWPLVPVKRILRKLMAWYLRYVTQQLSAFATSVVAALKLLSRRVTELETTIPGVNPRVLDTAAGVRPPADASPFLTVVADLFEGVKGRVLVTECGEGALLRRLVDGGIDAYGVDPHVELADALVEAGLEVRHGEALEHVRNVEPEALAGAVLCGCVDRLPLGAQLELADLLAGMLVEGGRVAVVGTTPAAWASTAGPVEADLALGRPLHAETWVHLLGRRGIDVLARHDGPPLGMLEPVADPSATVLNANLARIEKVLFGPASYVVTGARRR